jgi:hypothetical protein
MCTCGAHQCAGRISVNPCEGIAIEFIQNKKMGRMATRVKKGNIPRCIRHQSLVQSFIPRLTKVWFVRFLYVLSTIAMRSQGLSKLEIDLEESYRYCRNSSSLH